MPATQISFVSFAASCAALSVRSMRSQGSRSLRKPRGEKASVSRLLPSSVTSPVVADRNVSVCTPSATDAAIAVVAHPLAVGGGECPSEDRVLTADECAAMTEWYWSTLSSHNGVFSPGGFLIMSLRQVGDPDCLLSNDERMQAYDRLLTFAGECIGAGC